METNFVAIGRYTDKCIFVHKDDMGPLIKEKLTYKVKCVSINFRSKEISDPIIIDVLLRFCPYYDVISDGERSVINDLVLNSFSGPEIEKLNELFENNKLSTNRT